MSHISLGLLLIYFIGLFLIVIVELFLFSYLFLVVSNPNILIYFPLLGEVMEQGTSSFFIYGTADGNSFHISPKGHMGSCDLSKLYHG
jgi:hypothetical protein